SAPATVTTSRELSRPDAASRWSRPAKEVADLRSRGARPCSPRRSIRARPSWTAPRAAHDPRTDLPSDRLEPGGTFALQVDAPDEVPEEAPWRRDLGHVRELLSRRGSAPACVHRAVIEIDELVGRASVERVRSRVRSRVPRDGRLVGEAEVGDLLGV